jgi:lipocalin
MQYKVYVGRACPNKTTVREFQDPFIAYRYAVFAAEDSPYNAAVIHHPTRNQRTIVPRKVR